MDVKVHNNETYTSENGEEMQADTTPMDATNNGKRKIDAPPEWRKKKSKGIVTANKSAVQLLNEQFPGIEYKFTETEGTPHSPTYQVVAEIKEVSFEGNGPSKGSAKRELATKALAQLLNIIVPCEQVVIKDTVPIQTKDSPNKPSIFSNKALGLYDFNKGSFVDISEYFTGMPGRDRPLYVNPQFQNGDHKQPLPTHVMLPPEAVQQGFHQPTNRPTINEEKARSHPAMVLTEAFPNMELNWVEGNGHGDRQFKVEAEVLGRRFFGEGRSKKTAKLNLAKTILLCMYDIHDFKEIETAVKVKSGEVGSEKKFPMTQLKELIGEDNFNVEVIALEDEEDEDKKFHATVVAKGVAYEAVGKNRKGAKVRAAKKALEVLRPKKEDTSADNANEKGVDTSKHPTMVFCELFRDVKFVETVSKGENGLTEYHVEVEVEGKVFQAQAPSKKKAKLKLVLNVFEDIKGTPSTEWSTVNIKEGTL